MLQAEPGDTRKVQLGLFAPQMPEPSRLDVTLARIRAVVGNENGGRTVLKDTHAPDGFLMEPFQLPSGQPSAMQPVAPRPARHKLRPAELVFVSMQNERPHTFVFREQRYAVEQAYGPWIAGGEWWNASLWGCEQWDLAARAGGGAVLCCCLNRHLLRNRWQMSRRSAEVLVTARRAGGTFRSVEDMTLGASLNGKELTRLAQIGALNSLDGISHRRDVLWQVERVGKPEVRCSGNQASCWKRIRRLSHYSK
jgi:hypothetical protein